MCLVKSFHHSAFSTLSPFRDIPIHRQQFLLVCSQCVNNYLLKLQVRTALAAFLLIKKYFKLISHYLKSCHPSHQIHNIKGQVGFIQTSSMYVTRVTLSFMKGV